MVIDAVIDPLDPPISKLLGLILIWEKIHKQATLMACCASSLISFLYKMMSTSSLIT